MAWLDDVVGYVNVSRKMRIEMARGSTCGNRASRHWQNLHELVPSLPSITPIRVRDLVLINAEENDAGNIRGGDRGRKGKGKNDNRQRCR